MADEETAAVETEPTAPEPAEPQEPTVELPNLPVFGKYDTTGITIKDAGLAKYINLQSHGVPHHGGRWANTRFGQMKMPIVERLINNMMRTENYTGKKLSATRVVKEAFAIVAEKSKENPIQVLVNGIVNAAPKEETTRLKYGGISVPKAVDTAPIRRLSLSIRHIAMGAVAATHRSTKPIAQCLADEILRAGKGDPQSFAMAKKDDIERVAKSAR